MGVEPFRGPILWIGIDFTKAGQSYLAKCYSPVEVF